MRLGFSKLARLTDGRLDLFAATAGLVVSLALLPLGLFTTEILVPGVPTSIGLGCLLYLLSTRTDERTWRPPHVDVRVSRMVPRLVFVGLAWLVVVAVVAGGRPLAFLLLAGAVGSLIVANIVFADRKRLDHRVVLAEIVVYATVVRYAGLLTTPGFVGIDNWTHVTSYAAAIRETNSLAAISGIKYFAAPFYHLVTVVAADLLAVSLRTALYLTVGAVMPLSILLIFATARYVTDLRWALLAAALFAVSEYVVYWGLYVSTTSLGLVFFLVVLLVLTRIMYVDVSRTDFVLLTVFGVGVALTHQVSAFITLVVLGTASVLTFVSRYVDYLGVPNDDRHLLVAFLFLLVFTTVQWAVTPWQGGIFLLEMLETGRQVLLESAGFLNLVESRPIRGADAAGTRFVTLLATLVNNVGFLLFVVLTSLGALAMLRRNQSVGTFTLIGVIPVMMVFALGLPLFGLRFLLPARWFAFAYAPMAVVGAVGLKHFVDRFWTRGATVGLLVFLVVFPATMVMAQNATIDDPTFERQWPQYAHTASEVAAAETFDRTVPAAAEPIYTDHPYFMTLTRINEDPSERVGARYSYSAYMFTVDEDGDVERYQEPVVYRTYQSEAYPTYLGPDGVPTTRQLAHEEVCPGTRNHVYATRDVHMCA